MYQKKYDDDIRCPLEYGMKLFGGKWKSRIICVLNEYGPVRYSVLRKEMANISDAVLAAALKEIIADGLVDRIRYNEIPPHVEYVLTEKGKTVVPILSGICNWADVFYKETNDEKMPRCAKCNYREIQSRT